MSQTVADFNKLNIIKNKFKKFKIICLLDFVTDYKQNYNDF